MRIEESYQARFIIGKEADRMIAKAKKFLRKDFIEATTHWKEIYGQSAFWVDQ